jgi:hypothetical protein
MTIEQNNHTTHVFTRFLPSSYIRQSIWILLRLMIVTNDCHHRTSRTSMLNFMFCAIVIMIDSYLRIW